MKKFQIINIKALLDLQQSKFINIFRLCEGYSLTPFAVVFILTSRCNLNCKMCPQAKDRKGYIKWGGNELNFHEIKAAIDHIPTFPFKPRIHLSGGEPLLYKYFVPLIKYLRKKGVIWSITTNGFNLKKYAEEIIRYRPSNINISIDGPQKIHNELRGNDKSFQNAISSIKRIIKLRNEKRYKTPRIAVNCAIQPANLHYLEETINQIEISGADALTFEHFFFEKTNNWSIKMARQIDVSYLKNLMKKIQSTKYLIPVKFFPKIKIQDIDAYYYDLSFNFGNTCIAPWLIARVSPNGDVRLCHHGATVGNLVEKPINKIWNNTKIRNFRKKIQDKGLPNNFGCERCCHRQYYAKKQKIKT